MDLTPYLEALRRDLSAAAAAGGEEVRQVAEILAGSLDASARLALMEALADAADEVTAKLSNASVEIRLKGREASLVVTEFAPPPEPEPPTAAPAAGAESTGSGEVARITLRLPEGLKESVERAAAHEGISVNAWLVRAISGAVTGRAATPTPPQPPFPPGRASFGRGLTGYAQA